MCQPLSPHPFGAAGAACLRDDDVEACCFDSTLLPKRHMLSHRSCPRGPARHSAAHRTQAASTAAALRVVLPGVVVSPGFVVCCSPASSSAARLHGERTLLHAADAPSSAAAGSASHHIVRICAAPGPRTMQACRPLAPACSSPGSAFVRARRWRMERPTTASAPRAATTEVAESLHLIRFPAGTTEVRRCCCRRCRRCLLPAVAACRPSLQPPTADGGALSIRKLNTAAATGGCRASSGRRLELAGGAAAGVLPPVPTLHCLQRVLLQPRSPPCNSSVPAPACARPAVHGRGPHLRLRGTADRLPLQRGGRRLRALHARRAVPALKRGGARAVRGTAARAAHAGRHRRARGHGCAPLLPAQPPCGAGRACLPACLPAGLYRTALLLRPASAGPCCCTRAPQPRRRPAPTNCVCTSSAAISTLNFAGRVPTELEAIFRRGPEWDAGVELVAALVLQVRRRAAGCRRRAGRCDRRVLGAAAGCPPSVRPAPLPAPPGVLARPRGRAPAPGFAALLPPPRPTPRPAPRPAPPPGRIQPRRRRRVPVAHPAARAVLRLRRGAVQLRRLRGRRGAAGGRRAAARPAAPGALPGGGAAAAVPGLPARGGAAGGGCWARWLCALEGGDQRRYREVCPHASAVRY